MAEWWFYGYVTVFPYSQSSVSMSIWLRSVIALLLAEIHHRAIDHETPFTNNQRLHSRSNG